LKNLHSEELHDAKYSPNIIRVINSRMIQVAYVAYSILVGKPEGKTLLGSSRGRWEYNIKMNDTEIVWEGVDWIDLVEVREN
jgi:hypothetical protein